MTRRTADDDPLELCSEEHFTGARADTGIEHSRGVQRSDASALIAALVDDGRENLTNDDIYATGQRMGWTVGRTELARIDAVRAGLLSR